MRIFGDRSTHVAEKASVSSVSSSLFLK